MMSVKLNDNARPSLVDTLPPELIREVCGYLHRGDIQRFRLTCKTCAAAGIQVLVCVLVLVYTKESFGKLLNISKHPELSKYVRLIIYDPRMMCVRDTMPEMSRCFTAFKKMFNEQRSMKEEKFSASIFSQVLPNLTGLKAFKISIRQGPLQYDPFKANLGAFNWSKPAQRTIFEEAQAFLDAASKAGTKLEYLLLENVSWNLILSADAISPTSNWSHLRVLRIAIPEVLLDNGTSSHGLVQVLQTAYNVEELSIVVGSFHRYPFMDWNEVALAVMLPCLQNLNLESVFVSSISLVGFLKRHAKTLRSLRIVNCRLQGQLREWFKIFDTVRNDMTLEEVDFMPHLQQTEDSAHDVFPYDVMPLHYTYLGHIFWDLLEDRILNRNVLAKECNLTLVALWDGYVAYVISCHQEHKWRWY